MKSNFPKALEKVLVHEGGYVNHPDDPGGATNKGVTQGTYNNWLRSMGRGRKSVKYIADNEVHAIYKKGYWDKVRADDLPSGLDYAVFDGAVNSGPSRSIKWLQKALGGLTVDGKLGPNTMGKVKNLSRVEVVQVIDRMLNFRMGFLRSLRHWATFGRGWTNRVSGVEKDAKLMADYPNALIKAEGRTRPSLFELIADLLSRIFGKG